MLDILNFHSIGGPVRTLLFKNIFLCLIIFSCINTFASTGKIFEFKYSSSKISPFKISVQSGSKEEAFKLAAKQCFQKLTNGIYPGESTGMDYIDVCANPKM